MKVQHIATAAVLLLLGPTLTACGDVNSAGSSSATGIAPSSPDVAGTSPPAMDPRSLGGYGAAPEGCDPIQFAKATIFEEGWSDLATTVSKADLIVRARVLAERAGGISYSPPEGLDELPLVERIVDVEVLQSLKGTAEAGSELSLGNDYYDGFPAETGSAPDPCRVLVEGEELILLLDGDGTGYSTYLVNYDALFYVDGDTIQETGRTYGGIEEVESLSRDQLSAAILDMAQQNSTPAQPPSQAPSEPVYEPSAELSQGPSGGR